MCDSIMKSEPSRFAEGIVANVCYSNDPYEVSYIMLLDSSNEPLEDSESEFNYSSAIEKIYSMSDTFFEMVGVDPCDSVTVYGKYVIPFGAASAQDIREF